MQTRLIPELLATSDGREADRILRSCVHCGFCTATCPTYQLLGDELDGPRGRIYQLKLALEGETPTRSTQQHLDRCLTCLNCETSCPSGVEYHKLVEIGRERIECMVPRPIHERLMRWGLRKVLPYPSRFVPLLRIGQWLRPLLPQRLRSKVPVALSRRPSSVSAYSEGIGQSASAQTVVAGAIAGGGMGARAKGDAAGFGLETETAAGASETTAAGASETLVGTAPRRLLMLDNCVEPALTPATVSAARRVLAALGIEVVQPAGGGCCGAISQHLAAPDEAKRFMRRNIDAWWSEIEPSNPEQTPAGAILITASGCGAVVKDYGWHLRDDAAYAEKAARVSALARDLSELLSAEDLARLPSPFARDVPRRIAFHPPCTLQHGQRLMGRVEALLRGVGFELTPVRDAHSCCGSAGTYSILQAELSKRLQADRLDALQAGAPALIATANVGCQTHLAAAADRPVLHWIELFDPQRGSVLG
ncbi:heterodisulfide reductase-related iron-sulfur binding cluster [Lamprobacter modestohalophilus]|uniref:heterodisulfide reductase-related iron-sulfur binding cluster n=1 Tax=Lamprobacter modestohalophilus TaxID=1064514 RepID=UPI002ADEB12F|nr:heterodisulfide reductase-related iron-sulfur binding cluster [Lamprobacter modestohalophilus]MEA1050240.1 heterodisulfide reductase-related iron-sulfur binding cluster [Lamprobacter modestohalophilus]